MRHRRFPAPPPQLATPKIPSLHVGSKMAIGNGPPEKQLKVLLVGDVSVGKTTIFNRFKYGQFVEEAYSSSRGRFNLLDCKKHISSEGKEATVR